MPTPTAPSVVSKVALLLRSVANAEPDGITTSALARVAALNRSTAHRLLHELQTEGLIERDDATANWVVGPEMYLLGSAAGPRYDVTALAQPFVRKLAVGTGESAFFSVRRGLETVCLVREDGSFPLRSHVLYEGVRFPLGVASAGLAILAFMSPREVEAYLNEADLAADFGQEHARGPVESRMAATQRVGYAVNTGLVVEGSWGMGAAVFNGAGSPIGALSLTGVEHRFAPARQPELGRMLLDAAHGLTNALKSSAGPEHR
ncbi:MAG: IclR family transcriptional regulator [Nocardioides sp.]|nr:IclR family transcriptional regulator [Nocardioides sp.]